MGKKLSPLIKIQGNFLGKDILSIDQFSSVDIGILFSLTNRLFDKQIFPSFKDSVKGSIAALLFYEPSSRTFGSFDAAVKKLGGQTLDMRNPDTVTSAAKGESLEDTIRVFETYSDVIIMRHKEKGAAHLAADTAAIPVINAGDGAGEHPTQALLDIYTIYKKYGRLEDLTGLIAGDLLHGRTVHSLLRALALFKNNTIYLLSPEQLKLPKIDLLEMGKRGLKIIEIHNTKEIPKTADFWYWTRVQKERFTDLTLYEEVKDHFTIDKKFLNTHAGKNTILMHPLPRIGEILPEVDEDARSVYFRDQIRSGMFVRMALVLLVLGKTL